MALTTAKRSALRRSPRTQNRRMLEAVVQFTISINADLLTGSLRSARSTDYQFSTISLQIYRLPHGRSVFLILEACATVVVVSMEDLGRCLSGCVFHLRPGPRSEQKVDIDFVSLPFVDKPALVISWQYARLLVTVRSTPCLGDLAP